MSEVKDYKHPVTAGIGFGSALAITISWSVNHSVLWAIIHGLLSWIYVVYWCLFGNAPLQPLTDR